MIEPFRHQRPTDLDEALAAVASGGVPYVGGTELIAAMKLGLLAPDYLVDLKGVSELAGVQAHGTHLLIGAATPHAVVESDPGVRQSLPMLSIALRAIGNPRVRWQGTLGGNLCFAEPRSDLVPVLIALRAVLSLRSVRGERSVAAEDFVTDAFTVDRGDDELLVRISVDTADLRYQDYARIQHMERPSIGIALVQRGDEWRLCVGSVGYVPRLVIARSLDQFDPPAIASALEPIEDAAGGAEFKRSLAVEVMSRVLGRAREVS